MLIWMEYRIKGYTIADAVRPNPFWGSRRFTVDTDTLGTEDMESITEAARDTAPDGYELHRIEAL